MDRVAEIASYISKDNPAAAESWIRKLFAKAAQIADFPASGHSVSEISRSDIRELIWGNYRVIYRIETNQISILTIRHTRQILPLDELK
jgi:plasmid stabilization system protein ParE